MKRILFSLLTLLSAADIFAAAPTALKFWTGVGSGSTSNSYVVASANGIGVPVLSYFNVTGDNATNKLYFFSSAAPIYCTATAAASQAIVTAQDGSITNGNIVVIRSLANDTYQRVYVESATSSNWTSNVNLDFALAIGDPIYKQTATVSIPVGNATKELNAADGLIYAGTSGRPLLFQVTGTTACSINAASGTYK